MRARSPLAVCCLGMLICWQSSSARAADGPAVELTASRNGRITELLSKHTPRQLFTHSAVGVTRAGTSIPCLYGKHDLDLSTSRTRILLIGGLDGAESSILATLAAASWFAASDEAQPLREKYSLTVVPVANPDGWADGTGLNNSVGGKPGTGYPPEAPYYQSATNPEAQYLWQWIGLHAPDLVIDVRRGDQQTDDGEARFAVLQSAAKEAKRLGGALRKLVEGLPQGEKIQADELAAALLTKAPAGTGLIPAVRVTVPAGSNTKASSTFLNTLLQQAAATDFPTPSPARQEILRRQKRTAIETAQQLARRYGQDLKSVQYIPALALVGRLRLGELTDDSKHLADVQKIVEPWLDCSQNSLAGRVSGSTLSGHLIFAELAHLTGEKKFNPPVVAAAAYAFDKSGQPLPAMAFHSEMSDAVFMGCPILAEAARLTGEQRYAEACLRHMRFMLQLNLREDGLHRHSPLDETAWGRGNGFPALGLAMSLEALPEDQAGREEMLAAYRAHLRAMARYQDPTGMWQQVVDHPESYREFSCTAMTTYAMIRGIRRGWLDEEEFRPVIERAWPALLARIAPDGTLVDMCAGTGKQTSLRAYYERTAIHGADARGGAMGLMVTTEMAAWQQEQQQKKSSRPQP